MQLTGHELGIINASLISLPPEEVERGLAKEVYGLLKNCLSEDKKNFVDNECELNVTQRAFLVSFIPKAKWTTPQLVEFVDPLITKLNQ